jgi:hypothetical protein
VPNGKNSKMISGYFLKPNAGRQLLPEAGATQERTLEAVNSRPLFGTQLAMA